MQMIHSFCSLDFSCTHVSAFIIEARLEGNIIEEDYRIPKTKLYSLNTEIRKCLKMQQ